MNGIFLHTGWRTSGTWLWSCLRRDPDNMCFYEPLHEMLPEMSAAQMHQIGGGSWSSRHPETAPYFMEYLPLLRPEGGVRGALPAFGFDRFFLEPDATDNDLRGYVKTLCETARAAGKRPVLKFTRSWGRVGWLRRHFPEFVHVLVLRNAWTQFRSGWRCLAEDGNPYFLAAPIVVLERNTDDPDVAALIGTLDLPITPVTGETPMRRINAWYRVIPDMPAAALYRCAFAFWLLGLRRALPAAPLVLDADAAPAAMAARFAAATGVKLDMDGDGDAARPPAPRLAFGRITAQDILDAHAKALGRLAERIDPECGARLRDWLGKAEQAALHDLEPAGARKPEGLLRGLLPGIAVSD
jgi:hypothetical protein